MYIFVDESGNHKIDGETVVVLTCIERKNLSEVEQELRRIVLELNLDYFHWTDASSQRGWDIRYKFLAAISKLPINYKYALFSNPFRIVEALTSIFRRGTFSLPISAIIIDGKWPKSQERVIKQVLRQKGVNSKKLRAQNGNSSPGLWVADAMAGFLRSHNERPTKKSAYFRGLFEIENATHEGGQSYR